MAASQRTHLHPRLIAAVIFQESGGDPFAMRFEPAFYEKHLKNRSRKQLLGYVPTRCSLQTELYSRACSFGLMQILGETARENGFDAEFLAELCDPARNIELGCTLLEKFIDKVGSVDGGLLRYNGGGRKEYPKEVRAHMENGSCDFLLM